MPRRAMRLEARPTSWVPPKTTEPCRCGTIPMIARRVVVFPAPLRPNKVTTSPRPTAKLIPCRMCDSPYQACSSSTPRSRCPVTIASGMAGPQIRFHHLWVLRDSVVAALGKDTAAGQHRDDVGEIGHHRQIVLDHQDRALGCRLADQRRYQSDVLMAETGHRLVEQQHHRIERQ